MVNEDLTATSRDVLAFKVHVVVLDLANVDATVVTRYLEWSQRPLSTADTIWKKEPIINGILCRQPESRLLRTNVTP